MKLKRYSFFNKANKIIKKLSTDYKAIKLKSKAKSEALEQQEIRLNEQSTTIESLEKQFTIIKQTLENRDAECDQLKEENQKLEKIIKDNQETIFDNNQGTFSFH